MNEKERDYKKLYEEAQMKLDKIEYDILKSEIDKKLGLTRHLKDVYNNKEPLNYLKNKKVYSFLHTLYSEDAVENAIKEIGWEKLTKIIDDVYKEILEEEAKEPEAKK